MRSRLVALVLVSVVIAGSSSAGAGRRRSVAKPATGTTAAPVARADAYSITQGSTLSIAAPGVLGNDTLNGALLTGFGAATGAEQTALGGSAATAHAGTVSLASTGGFVYTPAATFSGTDTFAYAVKNAGGTSVAVVTIEVRAAAAQAVTDAYATPPEMPLLVPAPGVLTNDTLGGGRIVSFGASTGAEQTSLASSARTAQSGMITLHADGSFEYEPPPSIDDGYGYSRAFRGLDGFVYVIQSGSVSSKAIVNITVEVPPSGADFTVTTPGLYYAFSGLAGQNPVVELHRGRTYNFQIDADPAHPFAILDAPPDTVINNNITQGIVTFTVPNTAQNYRYRCTTHGFGNAINTVP